MKNTPKALLFKQPNSTDRLTLTRFCEKNTSNETSMTGYNFIRVNNE